MSKIEKLVVDVDGELVIYYDGVFKTSMEMVEQIKRNAFLGIEVQIHPNAKPVVSSLDGTITQVAAAIISVYPERARIIEAPEETLQTLYPDFYQQ
jgi:hypothetical protein